MNILRVLVVNKTWSINIQEGLQRIKGIGGLVYPLSSRKSIYFLWPPKDVTMTRVKLLK